MNFVENLVAATSAIASEYFQLPIIGKEDPIYRERVYCYELYHQLRQNWPREGGYLLNAEVDKSGHPVVQGEGVTNTKPDFLVHCPGSMDNVLVMEVKPVNATLDGIRKDFRTLIGYLDYVGYQEAYLLFYGEIDREELSQRLRLAAVEKGILEGFPRIKFYHHPKVYTPAYQFQIL